MRKWTRRAFIGAGSLVGGGFVLGVAGVAFAPGRHSVVSADAIDKGELTTWITVTTDNVVTVLVPHCEMGQGSQTGLAIMAAEEMEADWERVRIEEAPALDAYANAYMLRAFTGESMPAPLGRAVDYGAYRLARWFGTQATGGSLAVRGTGYGMRIAGAAAREMLLAAAAERFGVPAADCAAARSHVAHAPTGRRARFGELARAAAAIGTPSNPALKDPDTYTIRRTAKPRFDIPPKVNGGVRYGIDFTLPGMLHAAVDIAPVQGGRLAAVDPAPGAGNARREGGRGAGGGGRRRRRQLLARPQGARGTGAGVRRCRPRRRLQRVHLRGVRRGTRRRPGDAGGGRQDRHGRLPRPLSRPRHDGADGVHRAGRGRESRGVGGHSGSAERALRRGERPGLRHGPGPPHEPDARRRLRPPPPVLLRLRRPRRAHREGDVAGAGQTGLEPRERHPARLLPAGRDVPLRRRARCRRPAARRRGPLRRRGRPRVPVHAVRHPDQRFDARNAAHHIREGAWRSVLNSQHGFFKESFIDELAHAAGRDPYAFRRDLMDEHPRFRAALDRAAEMAGWGGPLPEGEGRGIAIAESFGSIVAQVAQVAVSPAGRLRVRHVHAAVDCGDVVNTDSAAAQIEGGVVFGLSAAMVGEITIDGGRVVESNFADHRMIRMADAPYVQVEFIRSGKRLGGLGEPGVPPVAPAVTNAIFAATGIRVRNLPIRNRDLSWT